MIARLLVRKERWTLSFWGKLLALGLVMAVAVMAIWQAHPFLAVNQPVNAAILVVEGWIPTYTLKNAAAEFKRGHYRKLLIVRSFDVDRYQNKESQAMLLEYGVPADSVATIFSPAVRKDRTYHSALAVRDWLSENGMSTSSINVATIGPHARRSRLMFQKAFENRPNIGIIALDDLAYDSKHWWRTSEGAREILGEAIAYVYARFLFAWA